MQRTTSSQDLYLSCISLIKTLRKRNTLEENRKHCISTLHDIKTLIKFRLWVLMRDQSLTHLCIDISLIPQHILDHKISSKS